MITMMINNDTVVALSLYANPSSRAFCGKSFIHCMLVDDMQIDIVHVRWMERNRGDDTALPCCYLIIEPPDIDMSHQL